MLLGRVQSHRGLACSCQGRRSTSLTQGWCPIDHFPESTARASKKDSSMGEDSEKSTKEKSSSTKASSSSKHVEKDYATDSATTTPSSAIAATDGSSIVVQPGEGVASIAARAGISVDELQRLNPDHMTNGYWFANPGDVVKVQ